MEIHELSARTTLADTDVFAVDTGSVTNKVTLANLRVGVGLDFKVYNSVTDIGLTSGSATILSAFNAMPNSSMLLAPSEEFTSGACPGTGIVEIVRRLDSRTYIAFHGKNQSPGDWRMFEGSSTYNGNTENAPNGVWQPDFAGLRGGTGSSGTTLQINLPNSSSHLLVCGGNGGTRHYIGLIFVNSSGALTVTQILAGAAYTVTTATNKVTVTSSSSGTELAFICLPIRGNPFTAYTIS